MPDQKPVIPPEVYERCNKTADTFVAPSAIELTYAAGHAAGQERGGEDVKDQKKPPIVCLCGSTKFLSAFRKAMFDETLAGRIVLTIGCDTKSDDMLGIGQDVKKKLDELHKRKIDLADEVLILNVGGYIGESTRSELAYARAHGKRVRWLETEAALRDMKP